jgi:hypothetical protein
VSESLFSIDYATARDRFRQAAAQLDWQQVSIHYEVPGHRAEDLTIDAAISGGDAERTLVVSSGLHGVEGFFGSAIQLACLKQWKAAGVQPDVRCVFLHSLNPYGFSHLRRFDERNVDPNRNFQPEGMFQGSPPGYAELNGLLNPQRPPSTWEPFLLKAAWQILRKGVPTLRQAISGGQYEFSQGLFFGGKEPSQINRILSERLPTWLADSEQVVHLDFHSGLGKFGTCKLLIDYQLTKNQETQLSTWFGANSYEKCDATDIAYESSGGFGTWCASNNLAANYLYACAEFGTYSGLKVLAGLRTENQAHHWGNPDDTSTLRAKQRLKELFCPASMKWRTAVLDRGKELVDQAILGLNGLPKEKS